MSEQMASIQDRLVECFRTVFPDLPADAVLTSSKSTVEDWDSLAAISLISVIEEEFDIAFDDDTPEQVTSFEAALDAVRASLVG